MIVQAVETATGMALVYLLACIFTSTLNEWIAQTLGRRGVFLNRGLQRMLPDQAIYRRLLHHPLISGLYRDRIASGRPPSYIAPDSFALALIDVVFQRSAAMSGMPQSAATIDQQALRDALTQLQPSHPRLIQSLLPIIDKAGGDYQKTLTGIEAWYSTGMDRVSGWYQARTRTILFYLGLMLAIVGNVDSIALARNFWTSSAEWSALDTMAGAQVGSGAPVSGAAAGTAITDVEALKAAGVPLQLGCLATNGDLSFGRRCKAALKAEFHGGIIVKVIGWLLTALAISLGSPFWFQALSNIVSMRGSGPPPAATGTKS